MHTPPRVRSKMDIEDLIISDLTTSLTPTRTQQVNLDATCPDDAEEGHFDHDEELLADQFLPHSAPEPVSHFGTPTTAGSDTETLEDRTLVHYDSLMSLCSCQKKCQSTDLREITGYFWHFDEVQRVSFLRNMLFALAAPVGDVN